MSTPAPGTCYKFTVASADEAAVLIRERLGTDARVLSVRTVEAGGLRRLWSSPQLEVIAQTAPPAEPPPAPTPESKVGSSDSAAGAAGNAAPQNPVAAAATPVFRRAPDVVGPNGKAAGRPSLPVLLRRSGISEVLLNRLEESPAWSLLSAAPLHQALVETGRFLRRTAENRRERAPLTRAAFLGTAGAGRTTALCKWLGLEVFRHARLGHVVTAEFDRPNPTGPLPVFCEALGVPVAHYPASTQPAIPGGFVYCDLPSISLRDPSDNAALAEFLEREQIEQRVLVLNAAYDHAALRAAYATGRDLGATHLVLTHLDEVPQWGRLWDYVFDNALDPLFLATGPSLTGDCDEDVFNALVNRTLVAARGGAASAPAAADADDTPAGAAPAANLSLRA
jgi:flagellar biosynthesis protein FlhF